MGREHNDVIVENRPRGGREWLGALLGVLVMLLAVPVGILLVGLPLVLLVRGAIAAVGWLLARLG